MGPRILLADDHELVRSGFRAMLERRLGPVVVGEAKDGREALLLAVELRPDLLLMDITMPGLNGLEATRAILAKLDDVKILCISMHSSARFVEGAFEAGASGYLLKDSTVDELVLAIRTVLAGRTYESPAISGTLLGAFRRRRSTAASSPFSLLTEREREVLQLISEGCSTKGIASRLHMSPKTVYTHRENLMDKLEIHSVAGLTKYAVQEGLTPIGPVFAPSSSDFF